MHKPFIRFRNRTLELRLCNSKQGSRYKTISNDKIYFLDQMMYCAAGTSLNKYLKSRKTDCTKGHFPYKWLTSYEKLYEKDIPAYKYFEKTKTTEEDYENIKKVWIDEGMNNMFDYLRYYNDLDVKPLVQAIIRHRDLYYGVGFDMHKDAISLSGLAEKILFKNAVENAYDDDFTFETVTVDTADGEQVQKDEKVYKKRIYLINEENKECFYLLKKNNVGGPSIVFHRYHEKDVTRISTVQRKDGKYTLSTDGKLIQKILGFDANALYLYAQMQAMPCGNLKYKKFDVEPNVNTLLSSSFGFYLVDISVPDTDEDYNKFLSFPPLFKNCKLKDGSRKLMSCMSAKSILLFHPLLDWYFKHGLTVTKVHGMIECNGYNVFKNFGELVSDERRKGDLDKDYEIIGNEMKNIGNSAYGRTSMRKEAHCKTCYEDYNQALKSVNTPYFRDADKFGELYEVQKRKAITKQNIPIHMSTAILNYGKLRMLQFYYDFLLKYVDRSNFNMMYMDTDSCYMAVTEENFEDLIKPEMNEEYEKEKNSWFPRTDTKEHFKYDSRTAGLFKVEYEGNGMICLNSKLNCLSGKKDVKDKFSCKGTQKNNNAQLLNYDNFKNVLWSHVSVKVENTGMRYLNGSVVQYTTCKTGLTAKYNKRHVMHDGVSTYPLNESEYE